jgi:hypothetical protein
MPRCRPIRASVIAARVAGNQSKKPHSSAGSPSPSPAVASHQCSRHQRCSAFGSARPGSESRSTFFSAIQGQRWRPSGHPRHCAPVPGQYTVTARGQELVCPPPSAAKPSGAALLVCHGARDRVCGRGTGAGLDGRPAPVEASVRREWSSRARAGELTTRYVTDAPFSAHGSVLTWSLLRGVQLASEATVFLRVGSAWRLGKGARSRVRSRRSLPSRRLR